MTQVFIRAFSTTKIDLNDEELQFYTDQKNKEISEVRHSLALLGSFSASSKKQRAQADLPLIWKSLIILAKILGYQADFLKINKLCLPQTILIQDLLFTKQIFSQKCYRSSQIVNRWQNENDRYIILLNGVLEKQMHRTSIIEPKQKGISKTDSIKLKRNLKKRYARTDEQIPICLNSKRSEMRVSQCNSGFFRAVTFTQTFQVESSFWKKYVTKFKQMEEDYLLGFIRKKIGINLSAINKICQEQENSIQANGENKSKQNTNEVIIPSVYVLESYERKTEVALNNDSIYLLYLGEMLVVTGGYRIETSKGCVLNSFVSNFIRKQNRQTTNIGIAIAKTDCLILKLNLSILSVHFESNLGDLKQLKIFLQTLEGSRRNKKDNDIKHLKQSSYRGGFGDNQIFKNQSKIRFTSKLRDQLQVQLLDKNTRSSVMTMKSNIITENLKKQSKIKLKTEESDRRMPQRKRIFECQQIQNRVERIEKAAELKKKQYLKKMLRTESNNGSSFDIYQKYSHINNSFENGFSAENYIAAQSLFKDSMSKIQTKRDLLKRVLLEHRQKHKQQEIIQSIQPIPIRRRQEMSHRDTSVKLIKNKIKQIFIKTTENQQILPFCEILTERNRLEQENYIDLNQSRSSYALNRNSFNLERNRFVEQGAFPNKRGVIKRVLKGHLRRIRVR